MLLVLAAIWGASFMFIKVGDRELDPLTLVGFRMALGAATLVPVVLVSVGARETVRQLRAAAGRLALIGVLNSGVPIYAISWAETRIDSGLTAVIQASAPLFTALLALAFVHIERVSGARLVGLLVGFRMSLGALTLAPIVVASLGLRRTLRELRAAAGPLVLTGLVNSAIPIFAITWAETRLDSGLTAAIQAAAPIFTALLAVWFSKREQVNGLRLVGLVIGFGGVALLVGAQPSGHVAAGLAVVFSAFCYAVAALYTATRLRGIPPLVIALGTLTAASLATLPPGLFFLPDHATGWKVTASVLTLGIAGTGIAYILYYAILTGAGASRGILVTYLVPALALGYGALLLGEPLSAAAVGGLALVLLGVALGTGALRLRRRRETAASLPL